VPLTLDGDLIKAAFASDGRFVATLSGTPLGGGRGEELKPDTTVRLWNVEIARERFARTLPGSEPALSSDGELVLTVDGTVVNLRRPADGSPHPADPLRHDQLVRSAAFSPDGAALTTLTDRAIYVPSLTTGAGGPVRVKLPARSASSIAFSADGHLVRADGAYGVAGVWEAGTGYEPAARSAGRMRGNRPKPSRSGGAHYRVVLPKSDLRLDATGRSLRRAE
jgi:WD40 repeat protein